MRNGFISRNRALHDKDVSLAIPAEVLGIKGNTAKVDFAESIPRGVNLILVGAGFGSTLWFTLDMRFMRLTDRRL